MDQPNPKKILTWNVNSILARLDRLLVLIEKHQPDVLCLQELKCTEEKFPLSALKALGYECSVFGQKAYNGVAICSRLPIADCRFPLKDTTPFAARAVGARIQSSWIYSVYVPNGQAVGSEKYHYKLSWIKELGDYFHTAHSPTDSIVVCGDFNIAPEDRDVHDPALWSGKILFSEPEKAALMQLTKNRFIDTFRLHESQSGHFSWWDYRSLSFPLNKGLRIDCIFVTKDLAHRCVGASIDRAQRKGTKPSDHAPVLAYFI